MMSPFKSFENLPLQGKSVLVRADFNVPMEGDAIKDTTRIDVTLPTLVYLKNHGALITLISHRGRPKSFDESLSLKPLIPYLEKRLQHAVTFDTQSPITLKENLRFHPGEGANDPQFSKELASGHDYFINDAFSVCHRAHASTVGVTHYLPSYAGLSLRHELETLNTFVATDQKPLMVLVGGSKITSKIDVLQNLLPLTDTLVIGGAMANTFLLSLGHNVGTSLVEQDALQTARAILDAAQKHHVNIILPQDVVTALSPNHPPALHALPSIPKDHMILDCGPQTIAKIAHTLQTTRTAIWNGPFGLFEHPPFDQGSTKLAHLIGQLTQNGTLQSLGGGGDTVAVLTAAKETQNFTAVCTAGGAFLDWLAGKDLPGLVPLLKE